MNGQTGEPAIGKELNAVELRLSGTTVNFNQNVTAAENPEKLRQQGASRRQAFGSRKHFKFIGEI